MRNGWMLRSKIDAAFCRICLSAYLKICIFIYKIHIINKYICIWQLSRLTSLWTGLSVCRLVGWSVDRSVGLSVCHNFLEGQEVSLPCSYQSTCFPSKQYLILQAGPRLEIRHDLTFFAIMPNCLQKVICFKLRQCTLNGPSLKDGWSFAWMNAWMNGHIWMNWTIKG